MLTFLLHVGAKIQGRCCIRDDCPEKRKKKRMALNFRKRGKRAHLILISKIMTKQMNCNFFQIESQDKRNNSSKRRSNRKQTIEMMERD